MPLHKRIVYTHTHTTFYDNVGFGVCRVGRFGWLGEWWEACAAMRTEMQFIDKYRALFLLVFFVVFGSGVALRFYVSYASYAAAADDDDGRRKDRRVHK